MSDSETTTTAWDPLVKATPTSKGRLLRRMAGAVVAGALALSVAGSPATAAGATPRAAPPLSWHPCSDDAQAPRAQCADLTVPVDWGKPKGTSIRLQVARRPALGKRLGVLVIDFGGPGDGGTDYLDDARLDDELSPALRAHFDLVAMDTRDRLVRCSQAAVAKRDALPLLPRTQAAFRQRVHVTAALGKDCAAHSPKGLLAHVDSATIARDVDALRTALGEKTISFYGISYGTLIGQMYAERFPRSLRALVLDSVLDHSIDGQRFLREAAAGEEDGFRAFSAWCADHTSRCRLPRNLPSHVDQLFRAARHGRLSDGTTQVSADELTRMFHSNLSLGLSGYGPLAHFLKQLTIVDRQPQPATDMQAEPARRGTPELTRDFTAVLCGDWKYDLTTFDRVRVAWTASRKAAPPHADQLAALEPGHQLHRLAPPGHQPPARPEHTPSSPCPSAHDAPRRCHPQPVGTERNRADACRIHPPHRDRSRPRRVPPPPLQPMCPRRRGPLSAEGTRQ